MEYLNKQEFKFGFLRENIEMIIYSVICFFVPFFIGHPQWVVGIIVNASLVLAALDLKGYKLLPVIMLPSLAVLSRGMIFGPFTIFLVYMVPFIWVGNFILVFAIKQLTLNKKIIKIQSRFLGCQKSFAFLCINKFLSLGAGALLKSSFLFAAAFIMVKIGFLPVVFLASMGILQVYTAIAGGLLAFGVHEIMKKIA